MLDWCSISAHSPNKTNLLYMCVLQCLCRKVLTSPRPVMLSLASHPADMVTMHAALTCEILALLQSPLLRLMCKTAVLHS